jgi:GR25 family glycosyltransferase involved in LPS biosynthesis
VVDHVYVINLDNDKDKLKIVSRKLKKLNIKFTRFPAINGKKIAHKYKTKLLSGQLGCLLSHTEIISDAIKNNYKKILVLEDDVIFDKQFIRKFNTKYSHVPKNYDLLYLGCSQTRGHNIWEKMDIYNHYYIPKQSNGTFAMIINKSIFVDLLKHAKKFDKPIDTVIIDTILQHKKVFSMFPHLITANVENRSSTNNKTRNMDSYLKQNKLSKHNFI